MTRALRLAVAALVAAASTAALAALSRVPYAPDAGDGAVLRLSWRARSELVQRCRRLSAEELERLPVHMRREEECEGRVLPYVLRVEVDGRELVHDTVRARGARGDRPLYVFRELPIAPGAHRVVVRFEREDAGSVESARDGEASASAGSVESSQDADVSASAESARESSAPGRGGRARAASPARLELDETVRVLPREVLLVTYDAEARTLEARGPAPRR